MSFKPPMKITVNTDGNEMEFVAVNKGVYTYKYSKSNNKFGMTVTFTEAHLEQFLRMNALFKPQPFIQTVKHETKIIKQKKTQQPEAPPQMKKSKQTNINQTKLF